MAERVVIATIDLDSALVDSKIRGTQQSFSGFGREVDRTSNVFTNRMFNMRTAAMAFLGSFTLAGVILGLKNLGEEAVRAHPKFEQAAASWAKFRDQLNQTIGVFLDLNTNLPKVEGFLDTLGKAIRALILDKDEADRLERQFKAPTLFGPPAPPGYGNEPRFAPALDEAIAKQKVLADQQALLIEGYHRIGFEIEEAFGDAPIEDFTFHAYELTSALNDSLQVTQFWQQALATSFSLIGSAIAESGFSARKALATLFQTMSQMAFSFAAMHVAAAIGSTTGLGAILTAGTPAQHKAAAAKWFGVGVLTAVAAAKVGGGAGGTAYGAGAGGGAEAPGPASRSYNVDVTIEGSLIGLGMSADEFARYIAKKINRALGDGALGGDINFQTVTG